MKPELHTRESRVRPLADADENEWLGRDLRDRSPPARQTVQVDALAPTCAARPLTRAKVLPFMRVAFAALTAGLIISLAFPLRAETIDEAVQAVEAELGGRVGVILRQPNAAPLASWRSDERFPMSSTFKVPLCGAVLARIDMRAERLHRRITYQASDIVPYSPVTDTRVGTGMSIADLCAATITLSDNTAGNLLLETLGGPDALTAFFRTLGDPVTRLDRWEVELNEGAPDDPRDTTTPRAMIDVLETLLFTDALSTTSRARLEAWMRQDQVADELIRASLPQGWTIADKTGAGGHGSRSIIAIIRPPDGVPWLAAIYLTDNKADMNCRNLAIARIGSAFVKAIAKHRAGQQSRRRP